jgi:molybdopterin synthase catalytic subunit
MNPLQTESLDVAALLEITAQPDSGALVVFGGTVRNENDGRSVSGIEYTAYAPLAEKVMAEIEQAVMQQFKVQQCRIVHRLGELTVGDLSVLVVVRAAHRAEAFTAARHAIDMLKQRVPIWKNEYYRDGDSRFLEGTSLNLSSE